MLKRSLPALDLEFPDGGEVEIQAQTDDENPELTEEESFLMRLAWGAARRAV